MRCQQEEFVNGPGQRVRSHEYSDPTNTSQSKIQIKLLFNPNALKYYIFRRESKQNLKNGVFRKNKRFENDGIFNILCSCYNIA